MGPDADAALICTPHNLHYQNVRDCLRAGLAVLVEKPMVITTRDAVRLRRLARNRPSIFSVAFNGSHSPAVRKAGELIAAGRNGEILSVNTDQRHPIGAVPVESVIAVGQLPLDATKPLDLRPLLTDADLFENDPS